MFCGALEHGANGTPHYRYHGAHQVGPPQARVYTKSIKSPLSEHSDDKELPLMEDSNGLDRIPGST